MLFINRLTGITASLLGAVAIIKISNICTKNNINIKSLTQQYKQKEIAINDILFLIFSVIEFSMYTILGFLMYYGKISTINGAIASIIMIVLLKIKKNKKTSNILKCEMEV